MKADVRKTGISVLGDCRWGTHFCLFYHTPEDLIDILVPYFQAGLKNQELCLWVSAEPLPVEAARSALAQGIEGLEDHLRQGQIEILDYTSWSTPSGRLEADRVLQGWAEKERQAIDRGWEGLRLIWHPCWWEKEDWKALAQYEAMVEAVIGQYRMVALCTYSLDHCEAAEIMDVVANHQFALMNREGQWRIIESGERRRAEQRIHLQAAALEAVGNGVVITDREGTILWVNPAFTRLTGYTREESIGQNPRLLKSGKHDRSLYRDLWESILSGNPWRGELTNRRKDGSLYVEEMVITPVLREDGEMGHFIAVKQDITERRRAEEELQRHRKFLEVLIEKAPVGIAVVRGPDHRHLLANSAYRAIPGRPGAPVIDRTIAEVFPAEVLGGYRGLLERVYRTGETVGVREYEILPGPGQEPTYWNADHVPLRGPDGRIEAVLILAHEVTEEVRASRRLGFLAITGAALASSLDYETTLQSVARLVVPTLADWCSVDLVDRKDGTLQQVAVAHTDPTKESLIRELRRVYPFDPDRPYGVSHVIRTGESELVPEVTDTWRETHAQSAEMLRLFRALDFKSYMIVPLQARDSTLGTITLMFSVSERRYGPPDLALAEELARRAALAIDNAWLYREIQEASRRKDEFLAMLSHELRNPLAAIAGAIQVLRKGAAEDPILRVAQETAERQTGQMKRLLDDLLDVSRITQGKIALGKQPVELAEIVDHAVQASRPLIQDRRHRLTVSLPQEPLRLEADPVRLEQVFINLLSNAAKYTPPGGQIWLSVGREGDQAILRVRDNGIGIAPELLPRIFDLFVQADRSLDRAEGGLGIGLTLVRELVAMHGGQVDAQSDGLGKGSEFVVQLPLADRERQRGEPPGPPSDALRSSARRILLVDDNEDAAVMLAMLLEMTGHEVRIVYDGPSALVMAGEYRPEVVLLDIGMPGMDGYEVARRLRRQEALPQMRLIALTGYGQEEDRQRAREAGFDHYLTKPIHLPQLLGLLSEVPEGP
ncbi:MAG: MEDS domain-containing protein [Candidatus Tectomicrobia bacterium]|uniref:histidine kinase n=1 Tax=Tectimicrobiota bacterium TaxID=2528274 RepID=A0A932CNX8_UNCTE|nr:MEDS domain-containing protein [Candidatus Tectomicrobia bacterium]